MEIYAAKLPADAAKQEEHQYGLQLLAQAYGAPLPPIAADAHGKPYFTNHAIEWNLSHSHGLAVCALDAHTVGIDTEKIRPLRPRVVNRSFSTAEQNALAKSEDPDALFTALWTLKESYVKALGVGVSYPLQQVEFALDGLQILSHPPDYAFHLYAWDTYMIACCGHPTATFPEAFHWVQCT